MKKAIAALSLATAASFAVPFAHPAIAQDTGETEQLPADTIDDDDSDGDKTGLLGLLGLLGLAGLLRKPRRDDDRVVVARTSTSGTDAGARSAGADRTH